MKTERKLFLFVLVVSFWAQSKAQDNSTNSYSLKEAQAYAIINNYQVKSAVIDIGISHQTVKSLKAIAMPQIHGTGSILHYLDIPTSVVPSDAFGFPDWFDQWIDDVALSTNINPNFPVTKNGEFRELQFGSKYSSSAGIALNQMIFDGSYLIALKAVKTLVQVKEQSLVKTEIGVKDLVAQAYHAVLVTEENIKILSANVNNVKKTLAHSEAAFKNGFMEETDVSQIKLMLSNLENSLRNAKQKASVSKNLLKFQMGLDVAVVIILTDDLEDLIIESNENTISGAFNTESHIDFKLARAQVTLMSINYKVEKSKSLPTISGFFNHQQNSFRNEFDFFDSGKWYPTTLWGLNLTVPIFGGFGKRANVQKAKLELEKSELMQTQVSQSLKLQMQSSKLEYSAATDHYQNQKQNLKLAETIRNKMVIKFQEGLASSMDLTQAENQFFNTQANYIQSVFRLVNAKSNLDKTAGQQ